MKIRDPLFSYAFAHLPAERGLIEEAEEMLLEPSEEGALAAFVRVRDAANRGSAFAMCICSRLARAGVGTEQSGADAHSWAKRAAETGFAPGIYELGLCFEKAVGVERDLAAAFSHYQQSADGGFGFAAHRLGRECCEGAFENVDTTRAVQYMALAYDLGESLAAYDLGQWYEAGKKVQRDYTAAVLWYERAAALGDPAATFRLHIAYSRGELGLPQNRTKANEYADMFAPPEF